MRLPLVIALRRSRRLAFLLLALHLLSIAALLPLTGHAGVRWGLAMLVLASLWANDRALRRQAGGVLRLGAHGAIEWQAQKVGAGGTARLDPRTLLLPGLVVLALRLDSGARIVLPVLADSVGAEDFRRLRLWLRMTGRAGLSCAA